MMTLNEWMDLPEEEKQRRLEEHREVERNLRKEPITFKDIQEYVKGSPPPFKKGK